MKTSQEKLAELCVAIEKWWEEHEHDIVWDGEDEQNEFDEEPDFVRLAKEVKADADKGGAIEKD